MRTADERWKRESRKYSQHTSFAKEGDQHGLPSGLLKTMCG